MDKTDFEWLVAVSQNLLFIGQRMVEKRNGEHALYFIEKEVLPAAKALRDKARKELGWSSLP